VKRWREPPAVENLAAMPVNTAIVADVLVLARASLRIEVTQHPFAIDVRRDGRRLLRRFGIWCADGEVCDQFIQFTEGVIASEELEIAERVASASVAELLADGAELALRFDGGRAGRLRITLPVDDTIELRLVVDGEPLRHAVGWDARDGEHFAGLGARHALRVDHAGRRIQLGADRSYTGPDCPPDMLAIGGVPQGDYAPAPWVQSSRGYAVHADGYGNGMRFHFGDDRTTVSARVNAGPLSLIVFTDPSPAARLRRQLQATGLPPVLPSGATGSGSRATSTATRARCRTTSTAATTTTSRSTHSSSTLPGRRNTTRGSPTPTSSPTSTGWCGTSAPPACGPSSG
jgi:hypothetical protein